MFLSLGLFILALLSKPVAVVLPVVLLLIDYYKDRKITTKVLLEKSPFLLLSLGAGVLSLLLKNQAGSVADLSAFPFPFPYRIVFASYAFITYLLKLLLPLNLSAFYPYPVSNVVDIPVQYYAYVLFFIGLVAYIIYAHRFSKKIIFGLGFFTVTILLLLQLLPVGKTIMADRYVYIPLIGIFYLAGEGFILLWNSKLKLPAIILLSITTVLFSVKTYAGCGVWKNDMTLWNNVIGQYNNIVEAYINRGVYFVNEKRNGEAINDFNKAIELNSGNADAYCNRGVVFMNEKRDADAITDFDKAIELKPRYARAYCTRGVIFMNEKINDKAINDFNKALELKSDYAEAYNNRGNVFVNEKRIDEAMKDFNRATELNPGFISAYNNKANLLFDVKRYEEAVSIYTRVIALKADYSQAYYKRGLAEFYSGKKGAACTDLKQAMSLGNKPAAEALAKICK